MERLITRGLSMTVHKDIRIPFDSGMGLFEAVGFLDAGVQSVEGYDIFSRTNYMVKDFRIIKVRDYLKDNLFYLDQELRSFHLIFYIDPPITACIIAYYNTYIGTWKLYERMLNDKWGTHNLVVGRRRY